MTNELAIAIVSAVLATNTNTLDRRSPGFSLRDRAYETNTINAVVTFKVYWAGGESTQTNTLPLATNVQRFNWTAVPLAEPRRPLEVRDAPPLPPGATNQP